MADVKFGLGQIASQTPKTISLIKRALNFFFGGIVVFLPQLSNAFNIPIDTFTLVMGIIMLFVNTVGIMFGVEPDSQTTKNN